MLKEASEKRKQEEAVRAVEKAEHEAKEAEKNAKAEERKAKEEAEKATKKAVARDAKKKAIAEAVAKAQMQYMVKEHDALFSKVSMPHKSKDSLLKMKQDEVYEPLSPRSLNTSWT